MLKWWVIIVVTVLSCNDTSTELVVQKELFSINSELEDEFKWLYYSMNFDSEVSIYKYRNHELVSDTSSLLNYDLTLTVEKCDSILIDVLIYPELPDTVFVNLKGKNFPILAGFRIDRKRKQILPIFEGGQLDVGLNDSLFVIRRSVFEKLIRFDQVEVKGNWLSLQVSRMRWDFGDTLLVNCRY